MEQCPCSLVPLPLRDCLTGCAACILQVVDGEILDRARAEDGRDGSTGLVIVRAGLRSARTSYTLPASCSLLRPAGISLKQAFETVLAGVRVQAACCGRRMRATAALCLREARAP